MAPNFDGKVIIVTGGARGIGRVYAQELAKAGAKVVVSDILDGEPCASGIREQGGEALSVKGDVTSESSMKAMAAVAADRYGRIDGLVNNAAIFAEVRYAPFDEISVAEWDAVMDVNVKGVWLASRAVYPHMKEQGSGKIVNIASGVPFKGIPVYAHYTVSKGAVVALTRVLARATGKDGICVNAVAPGLTRSESLLEVRGGLVDEDDVPQIQSRAIPRSQYPQDLVGAVMFFLSDAADFITGQTLLVDGGSYMH